MFDKIRAKLKLRKGNYEEVDPTPIALPVNFKRPPTLQETIAQYMAAASRDAAARGMETFEEAEDFDCEDDDFDPSTPWEMEFEPLLGKEVTKADREVIRQANRKFQEEFPKEYQRQKEKAAKKAAKKLKADVEPTEE